MARIAVLGGHSLLCHVRAAHADLEENTRSLLGTAAARDEAGLAADSYHDCFIRDFMVSGLVFLAAENIDTVCNFLLASIRSRFPNGSPNGSRTTPVTWWAIWVLAAWTSASSPRETCWRSYSDSPRTGKRRASWL